MSDASRSRSPTSSCCRSTSPSGRAAGSTAPGERVVAVLCAGLSLFAVFWVLHPIAAERYRSIFLAVVLLLTFLVFRAGGNQPGRHERRTPRRWTGRSGCSALAAVGYAAVDVDELFRRAADPEPLDVVCGVLASSLILEATRRTVGWILPAICIAFLAYAYLGGLLPDWTGVAHKGYGLDRLVGQSFMGLEGIFGIPLDVAATYIVLFTLYGAVLEHSGAARFFVELSHAAFGKSRTGPGRTTTLAGFLLGTVSGSGVATTVTLGSVTWPLLRKAGYPKNEGGGVLAAAGIGAILSPPTIGAAAFIIAEFLEESYLNVLVYATVPTLLYYLGVLLAIEADARRFEVRGLQLETEGFWRLLARFGYHFLSLFAIVGLLAIGFSPFRAVLYATVLAFLLSFLNKRDRMTPPKLWAALVDGRARRAPDRRHDRGRGAHRRRRVAHRARAQAGVADRRRGRRLARSHRGVLGDRDADPRPGGAGHRLVHHRRGDHRAGLHPARGGAVRRLHVHLLLRGPERGEPADRAVGLRGRGDHRRRRLPHDDAHVPLYGPCLPRPVRVRPDAEGEGLLLQGDAGSVAVAVAVSAVAVCALAVALGGWLRGPVPLPLRALFGAGGLLLLYLEPLTIAIGLGLVAVGLALQLLGSARSRPAPPTPA